MPSSYAKHSVVDTKNDLIATDSKQPETNDLKLMGKFYSEWKLGIFGVVACSSSIGTIKERGDESHNYISQVYGTMIGNFPINFSWGDINKSLMRSLLQYLSQRNGEGGGGRRNKLGPWNSGLKSH